MPWRPCVKCGTLVMSGSYCSQHKPVSKSATRQTPGRGGGSAAAAFRKAVIGRSEGRCEAVVDGQRCNSTDRVQAHHIVKLRDGGSNNPLTNGLAACRRCHTALDRA
jgi:predicted restriction endonuclease